MRSNQFAAHSLKRISEALFAQIQSLGIFSLDLNSKKDMLNEAIVRRLAFTRNYFQILEEIAELSFDEDEVPLLYNTQNWPPNIPPAGYSSIRTSLKPSLLLDSYLGSWYFHWTAKEEDFWSAQRFLKSALWMLQHGGVDASIRYLFDLQRHGFVLDHQDIYDALSLLIKAQRIVDRDEDLLTYFFGEVVPDTYHKLIQAEFIHFDLDRPVKRPISSDVVQALINAGLDQVERVRKSTNYDAWLSGQWILASMLSQIQSILNHHLGHTNMAIQAILDQFEEMRADAGGIKRVFHAQMFDSGYINRNPLSSNFGFKPAIKAVCRGIQLASKKTWKARLFQDRCLVPFSLQPLFLDENFPTLPFEWRLISPNLATTFCHVVIRSDLLPDHMPMKEYTSNEILNSRVSREVFEAYGIQDAFTQRILAMECTGEWQRFSFEDIARELLSLDNDLSDPPVGDSVDEFSNSRESINEWLDNNKDAVQQIILELKDAFYTEELQVGMDKAYYLDQIGQNQDRITVLENILHDFPWFGPAHLEIGIAYDKAGQLQRALQHIETAIVMRPLMHLYWQSLSVILGRLGFHDEAKLANGLFLMLNESDKNLSMS